MALARYFSSQPHDRMRSFVWYLPAFAIILVPFVMILEQPDLGTALMLLFGGLVVVFSAGLPWRHVFGLLAAVLAAVPLLWVQLKAYQKARVMTFLNPESDVLGAGYQIAQSKIALGSGGFFGKGFLMGSQSQLNYLPEKQTDFVFTMIDRPRELPSQPIFAASGARQQRPQSSPHVQRTAQADRLKIRRTQARRTERGRTK